MRKLEKYNVVMFELPDFSQETEEVHEQRPSERQYAHEHEQHTEEHSQDEPDSWEDNPEVEIANQEVAIDMKKHEEDMLKLKQSILEEAEREAEAVRAAAREEGYKAGYDDGFLKGKEQAISENAEEAQEKAGIFSREIKAFVEGMENEKDKITEKHMENLKELALSIAEKVIGVSLKSSGEVVKTMLASAVEKSRSKQWAKVYISGYDEELIIQGGVDILDAVNGVSEQVKLEIMENRPLGTCIVEFPDQIIDASAKTQLDNIKQLLDDRHEQ